MPKCQRCAHDDVAHQHYRSGSDCALCDCPKYKTRRWWTRDAPAVPLSTDKQDQPHRKTA